jgi:hypothetical protein
VSFTYNPFLHIQVVNEETVYKLYCPSCGKLIPVRFNISLRLVFQEMDKHVVKEHDIGPLDTIGWGLGV